MNINIIEAIKTCTSVSELKEVAIKNGYSLTDQDAKKYFELYHNNGLVSDDELSNVSGGVCGVNSMVGVFNGNPDMSTSTYSSDYPYHLIVTAFNSCDSFDDRRVDPSKAKVCPNCGHFYMKNAIMYCNARSRGNDPHR